MALVKDALELKNRTIAQRCEALEAGMSRLQTEKEDAKQGGVASEARREMEGELAAARKEVASQRASAVLSESRLRTAERRLVAARLENERLETALATSRSQAASMTKLLNTDFKSEDAE